MLGRLLGEYVAGVGLAALPFATGRSLKPLGGRFVRLHLRHGAPPRFPPRLCGSFPAKRLNPRFYAYLAALLI